MRTRKQVDIGKSPRLALLAAIALSVALSACGSSAPRIRVEGAWVRAGMDTAAAYMIIHNEGAAADVFIGARSDAAGNVGLHQTVMKGQVVGMEPVSRVEVPAGGRLELQPGGLHLMLSDLKQNLMPGQRIRLILQFEKAGEVSVEAEVRPLTGEPMSTPLPTGHGH